MTIPNIPEFPETIEERQKYLAALDLQRTQEDLNSQQHQQITRAIDRGYERLRRENLPDVSLASILLKICQAVSYLTCQIHSTFALHPNLLINQH